MLPSDSHEQLNKRTAPCLVAYAEVQPRIRAQFVSYFLDKKDVIAALRASCNIPFYFNGNSPAVRVRGAFAVDGFFTAPFNRFGCPPTGALEREILVSPYSASLVRLNPDAARKEGQVCRYDVISPDLLTSSQWPFTLLDLVRMSLGAPGSKVAPGRPISDEELAEVYQQLFLAGAQAVTNWYNINMQKEGGIDGLEQSSSGSKMKEAKEASDNTKSSTDSSKSWWNF